MVAKTQRKIRTSLNSQRSRVWFRKAKVIYYRISKRRGLSVLLVGILAFFVSASLSFFVRMPQPAIHDEFSYLLAADTLARGRLTNPTHPMWVHFESIRIIHQPTYASKFHPGQGLMLAAGQVIAGHPIVGAWLGTALGCAAVCWMLYAWLPFRWALAGGLLIIFHPTIVEWGQSYWGGAVAMTGGALLLGATRRIVEKPLLRDGWVLGLGMSLLAISRPYEGALLSLLACAWLALRGMKQGRIRLLLKPAVPVFVLVALTAAAMGYYNYRVTGDALKMPYLVHEETYAIAPLFIFQSPKPKPIYRHDSIERFQTGWQLEIYRRHQTLSGLLKMSGFKTGVVYSELSSFVTGFSPLLMVPLVIIGLIISVPELLRSDTYFRIGFLFLFIYTLAVLLVPWTASRFMAPITGLFLYLILECGRRLHPVEALGLKVGWLITRTCILMCLFSFVSLSVIAPMRKPYIKSDQRGQIIDTLKSEPGKNLIIVRYGAGHNIHQEWVYNEADIDNASVVWAREMDETQNRRLLEYFNNRRVWLLEADAEHPELVPYNGQR